MPQLQLEYIYGDIMFGKQIFYCNNCGIKIITTSEKMLGRDWRVCSIKCLNEINIKVSKSILGESV